MIVLLFFSATVIDKLKPAFLDVPLCCYGIAALSADGKIQKEKRFFLSLFAGLAVVL